MKVDSIKLILLIDDIVSAFLKKLLPNQKFSWEHSRIKVGRPAMPRQIFVGLTHSLSWAYVWHMSRLLREASHNAAHNI